MGIRKNPLGRKTFPRPILSIIMSFSPGISRPFERIMIFVDGGYVRKSFYDLFGDDIIDFGRMKSSLIDLYNQVPENPFRANLIRAYYYDAIVDKKEKEYDDQRRYFDRIASLFHYTVRLGEAVKSKGNTIRQKGVDVLMAVDALTMAFRNYYDSGIFFLADRDFVHLIEAVKWVGKKTFLVYWRSVAFELSKLCDFSIGISEEQMEFWHGEHVS